MIVASMTKEELLKEITLDKQWVEDRAHGIVMKYRKKTKNFRGRKVLGVTNYTTPRNNDVTAVWCANCFEKGVVSYSCSTYFRFMSPRGYQYITIIGNASTLSNPLIFTSHSIDRLMERCGMTFKDYIIECELSDYGNLYFNDYEYKGKVTKAMVVPNRGMFITVDGDWGWTTVTFIDKDLQGKVQNDVVSTYESQRGLVVSRYENFLKNLG